MSNFDSEGRGLGHNGALRVGSKSFNQRKNVDVKFLCLISAN